MTGLKMGSAHEMRSGLRVRIEINPKKCANLSWYNAKICLWKESQGTFKNKNLWLTTSMSWDNLSLSLTVTASEVLTTGLTSLL